MIIFTCDIDWAPEEVIKDTLTLFEKYGIKCTFFATHKSDVLLNCNRDLFEIGIHPNFNPLLNGESLDCELVVDSLLKIYPEAKGVRAHSLFYSTTMLNLFASKKLTYEINQFQPYQELSKPYKLWNGLVRIPFNWEDDIHLLYNDGDNTKVLPTFEVNIFNFHPIHIYLNSCSMKAYERVKTDLNNLTLLENNINKNDKNGIRNILIQLLEKNDKSLKLSEFITDL